MDRTPTWQIWVLLACGWVAYIIGVLVEHQPFVVSAGILFIATIVIGLLTYWRAR